MKIMYTLINDEALLNEVVAKNAFVLVFFSGTNCNVCNALKPKIGELFSRKFSEIKLVEIKVEDSPEISATRSVFTIPTIILYAEGRETIRESRSISIFQLEEKIEKLLSIYNS